MFRFSPRSFARFIGDLLNAREHSSCDIASSARASVRASRPAGAAPGANGESALDDDAKRTFQGHTSREVWRLARTAIPLGARKGIVDALGRHACPRAR